ncbi:MAG: outer membrane lipoprotein chaperone LolA, partial [Thiohalomonadales bacterium]|nr:outer membrane lipoprotein chaperone LolA [Thiohalomonadales bacterium]
MKFLLAIVSLLFSVQLQAQSLQLRFSGLDSFSAEFTQKLFDADQVMQEESSGILRVQRPNRFNLEYRQPYYQLYVADGKDLYFYDKDLEQVTVKAQEGMLENTPAMLLSNPSKLDQLYYVKPLGKEEGLFWYELTPKQPGGSFDRISLAFKGNELRVMELQDSFGQTTRLMFKNIQHNPDLNPKLFRFIPPKGVDV